MKAVLFSLLLMFLSTSVWAAGTPCSDFGSSTEIVGSISSSDWRIDYPKEVAHNSVPWRNYHFQTAPAEYMKAVLDTVRLSFVIENGRLTGTGKEPWWISLWMDYGEAGREPYMGLTKERGPDRGDLSPNSTAGSQIWAVNFYNASGATILGQMFADKCDIAVPDHVVFPEGTVAIKFLFTDANLGRFENEVPYLNKAPVYDAWIDPEGVRFKAPTENRMLRHVNLLQLDIAVKDERAVGTGWVFGTFVWTGPTKGDGLFDNLMPTALMWANDAGNVSTALDDSWIDPGAKGKVFGWEQRPFLGFLGRANGPADNMSSSCLSCHAAARLPSAYIGTVKKFPLKLLNDPAEVSKHVKTWFQNLKPAEAFEPTAPPAIATMDYSLQLVAVVSRLCQACEDGALRGPTPSICLSSGLVEVKICPAKSTLTKVTSETGGMPPRQ